MRRPTRTPARLLALLPLALAACGGAHAPGAATAEPEPPPTHELVRVADGVFQLRYGHHYNFFVVTSEGVVAFDPLNPDAAGYYVDAIREVAPDAPLLAIIYSHDHTDHASGAQVLLDAFGQDTPIIAHERAVHWIRLRDDPTLLQPTRTVGDDTTLEFGDTTIELHYLGDAHTDTMLVALLPDRDILFAVDFVSSDRVGWRDLPGIDMDTQVAQIRRLLELDFDTVAFGHGPPGDRATVERQLQYYEDLRREVLAAVADGLSEDETVERVVERLPQYRDWGSYDEWFRLNVRGVYRWATERRGQGG